MFDCVIVGGGPAGLSAAVYCATEGLDSLLLEPGRLGGQASHSARIDNYLGFPRGISGADLTKKAIRQLRAYGGRVEKDRIVALRRGRDSILLQAASGLIIPTRTVVVATGVQYRSLDIPGIHNFGVFYGNPPEHAAQWKGKVIGVIGGANSAGQFAVHYAEHCSRVHLLVRADGLDKGMSAYLAERVTSVPNIEVHTETEVKGIIPLGNDHTLRLDCTRGSHYLVDGLFLFIGAEPNTGWLVRQGVECDGKGFILCGANLEGKEGLVFPHETSVEGVFAVGDVRYGSVKRVASAVGDGASVVSEIHQYLERMRR